MAKHLYNTKLRKVLWFIKRFGASEMMFKPLRVTFAPLIIPLLPKGSFEFQGCSLPYFYHRYNMTWATERAVEVPIGKWYVDQNQGRSILEVGNVLSHYFQVSHDILDKYEKGPGVINEDIIAFRPSRQYDLIISISTFEHIGFDDEATEPSGDKILRAIDACRRLLTPSGKMVLTVPIGYNPDLDRLISNGDLKVAKEFYLHRSRRTVWELIGKEVAMRAQFKTPFPYANAILVAELLSHSSRGPTDGSAL